MLPGQWRLHSATHGRGERSPWRGTGEADRHSQTQSPSIPRATGSPCTPACSDHVVRPSLHPAGETPEARPPSFPRSAAASLSPSRVYRRRDASKASCSRSFAHCALPVSSTTTATSPPIGFSRRRAAHGDRGGAARGTGLRHGGGAADTRLRIHRAGTCERSADGHGVQRLGDCARTRRWVPITDGPTWCGTARSLWLL